MCRFYAEGICRYGDECPFAHSAKDIASSPDLTKTSLCVKWQSGECPLPAESCPFAHGEGELRLTPAFTWSPLSRRAQARAECLAAEESTTPEKADGKPKQDGSDSEETRAGEDDSTLASPVHTGETELAQGSATSRWGSPSGASQTFEGPPGLLASSAVSCDIVASAPVSIHPVPAHPSTPSNAAAEPLRKVPAQRKKGDRSRGGVGAGRKSMPLPPGLARDATPQSVGVCWKEDAQMGLFPCGPFDPMVAQFAGAYGLPPLWPPMWPPTMPDFYDGFDPCQAFYTPALEGNTWQEQ